MEERSSSFKLDLKGLHSLKFFQWTQTDLNVTESQAKGTDLNVTESQAKGTDLNVTKSQAKGTDGGKIGVFESSNRKLHVLSITITWRKVSRSGLRFYDQHISSTIKSRDKKREKEDIYLWWQDEKRGRVFNRKLMDMNWFTHIKNEKNQPHIKDVLLLEGNFSPPKYKEWMIWWEKKG